MNRKEWEKQYSEFFFSLERETLYFKRQKEIQHQREKIKRDIGRNLDFPIFKVQPTRKHAKQNTSEGISKNQCKT